MGWENIPTMTAAALVIALYVALLVTLAYITSGDGGTTAGATQRQ